MACGYPRSAPAFRWPRKAYLELGETTDRIELFDGSLYLTARGQPRHQFIVGELMDALRPAAEAAGLHLLGTVNLRLRRDRITNPDLSRVLKHQYYAAAGIPWFLLVEEETGTLCLHQLAACDIMAWPALAALRPEDLLSQF